MELPQSYVIDKFYSFSTNVRENSLFLNGCCPVCREGNSWGSKRRLYYFIKDDYFFCHNCNQSWTPYFWIKEVSGMSFKEIKEDLKDYDLDTSFKIFVEKIEEKQFEIPPLPGECVNLKDSLQVDYFKSYPVVKKTKNYCEQRRLFTALNAPKTFYCCLNDKFHANRLIIPFYDERGKVESYISRKIFDSDKKAKYLMKFGSKKPIFNLSKVDENFPYIFIFEGQIDSMFVKNGVAVSGVHLTSEQDEILMRLFPFHKKIWVLDNFRFEKKEVVDIIISKLKNNETVFLYNDEFSEYKDLNDFCIKKEQDFVDPALILKGSFSGDEGLIKIGD